MEYSKGAGLASKGLAKLANTTASMLKKIEK